MGISNEAERVQSCGCSACVRACVPLRHHLVVVVGAIRDFAAPSYSRWLILTPSPRPVARDVGTGLDFCLCRAASEIRNQSAVDISVLKAVSLVRGR